MQYIQLKPQISTDIPSPADGNFNFFINVEDNTISIKDQNDNVINSGEVIVLTKEDMDTKIANSGLTVGTFYKITGVNSSLYGGTDVILQSVEKNKLSKNGVGFFWNPKYEEYDVWDYTHRLNFNNSSGRFYSNEYVRLYSSNTNNSAYGYIIGLPGRGNVVIYFENINDDFLQNDNNLISLQIIGLNSEVTCDVIGINYTSKYNINDKVIWGGKVWKSISGNVSTSVNNLILNSDDWELVDFSESDYNLSIDEIEYDYENDNISFRSNGLNYVRQDWKLINNWWGNNQINMFPWGHPNVSGVKINNAYLNGFINFHNTSTVQNLIIEIAGEFSFNYCGRYVRFYDITFENWASFYNNILPNGNEFGGFKLGTFSSINWNTFCDNDEENTQLDNLTLGMGASVYSNTFYYGSYIEDIVIGDNANIHNNSFGEYARLYASNIIGAESSVGNLFLNQSAEIRYLNLADNSYIQGGILDVNVVIENVNMETNSHISNISIGAGSLMKQISLDTTSRIETLTIGTASNFKNVKLNINAEIIYTVIGDDSVVDSILINNSAYINQLTLTNNSNFSFITLSTSAYIYQVLIGTNSGILNFDLLSSSTIESVELKLNATLSYFNLDVNSSINNVTIADDIIYSNFKIGIDSELCCETFLENKSDVIISKNFNNLKTNSIGNGGMSWNTNPNELPNINVNNSIQIIDITDVPYNNFWFYLPNGNFEGQELKFILTGNGVYDNDYANSADRIQIFIENARAANGTLFSGGVPVWFNWYPFIEIDNTWRSMATCVWSNNAWTTDNNKFD